MTSKQKFKFSTTLLQNGKTATGIKIPVEIIERLGAGKKPAIRVTINGFTYRSTVAVMGGAFMVGVNAENREGARVKGGDKIDVAIELDSAPRQVEIPIELENALAKNEQAKQMFETLSYSKKSALIYPIAKAKTEQTRDRNIAKALNTLRGVKK